MHYCCKHVEFSSNDMIQHKHVGIVSRSCIMKIVIGAGLLDHCADCYLIGLTAVVPNIVFVSDMVVGVNTCVGIGVGDDIGTGGTVVGCMGIVDVWVAFVVESMDTVIKLGSVVVELSSKTPT